MSSCHELLSVLCSVDFELFWRSCLAHGFQISRDLSAAFPLAAVIAALSDCVPEFAALVYNRLANKCPLVVPKFPRQEREMRELLGFTRQPRASSGMYVCVYVESFIS